MGKRRKKGNKAGLLITVLFLSIGRFLGDVWGQDADELIRSIDEQQRGIQTLTGSFTQKKESSLAKAPLLSTGVVKFKRPDKVHFVYTKPEEMEIALEGKTIWLYYPIQSQAEKYSFAGNKRMTQYLEPITGIFQKTFSQVKETYAVTYLGIDSHRVYLFRLQPKEEKIRRFLSRVDLWIDKASGAILRFEMIEAGKDRLLLEFSDLRINPPLKDEELAIRIPPSVRVMEQISP